MTNSYSSYDEALGPRNIRYFGTGYQNVGHDMSGFALSKSTEPGAKHTAMAHLSYPLHWSTKKHRELVPHVSSVDTIIFAVALCDAAITHSRRLSAAETARMWVRHMYIRAGAAPHLDLAQVPVRAEVTAVAEADPDEIETTFTFAVGNLSGALTMVHPVGAGTRSEPELDHFGLVTDIFGDKPHYYLNGVKSRTLSATDITVDAAAARITGRQLLTSAAGEFVGGESAYPDMVSPVDGIVGVAQLAQILLYHLDSLDRTSSNTMWMRKLELFCIGPHHVSTREPFDGVAEIRRASVINRGGQRWRSAQIEIKEFAECFGSCLLAHQLPD